MIYITRPFRRISILSYTGLPRGLDFNSVQDTFLSIDGKSI